MKKLDPHKRRKPFAVTINRLPRSTIRQFGGEHGLVLEVNERDPDTLAWIGRMGHGSARDRFWASFKGVEVKDGAILTGAFGNGSTPDAAIRNYAHEISGKKIVVDAYQPTRREIDVPILTDSLHEENNL